MSEQKCIICGLTRDQIYPLKIQGLSKEDQKRLDEAKDGEIVLLPASFCYSFRDNRPYFLSYEDLTICPPCLKKSLQILANIIKERS